MIHVTLTKNKNKNITSYKIEGHSTNEKICTAISVIGQIALVSMIKIKKIDYLINHDLGYIYVKLPYTNDKTNIITECMEVGIKEIQKLYPNEITIEVIN